MKRNLLTTLLLVLSFVGPAGSSVHRVPHDHGSINEALAAAADGDTVLVAPGTYSGPLNRGLELGEKDLCIVSESGPEVTVIDCEQEDRAFLFSSAQSLDTTLSGFTIRNGFETYGAGIKFDVSSAARIVNCIFENGRADRQGFQGHGGAITCYPSACPVIEACVFVGNYAERSGGAISAVGAQPVVVGCTFEDNRADLWGGGLSARYSSSPVIRDCVFTGNSALALGGAVYLKDCIASTVVRCQFQGNWSLGPATGWGGAVYCGRRSSAFLAFCTFESNSAERGGGVATDDGAAPEIVNCTFFGNQATDGAGVSVGEQCHPTLVNTIIAFSQAGNAVWCHPQGSPDVYRTVIYGNPGGDWVGCLGADIYEHHNMHVDPLFCLDQNPGQPYSLHVDSPCAPENNSQGVLIGAWPVACGPTAVLDTSWGYIKALYRHDDGVRRQPN